MTTHFEPALTTYLLLALVPYQLVYRRFATGRQFYVFLMVVLFPGLAPLRIAVRAIANIWTSRKWSHGLEVSDWIIGCLFLVFLLVVTLGGAISIGAIAIIIAGLTAPGLAGVLTLFENDRDRKYGVGLLGLVLACVVGALIIGPMPDVLASLILPASAAVLGISIRPLFGAD